MAKKRKVILGSVIKGRDSKPDYIKVNGDHVIKNGQFLNLETKAAQLASLDAAVAAGKLQESTAATIRPNIERIPDFVRFQITTLIEE